MVAKAQVIAISDEEAVDQELAHGDGDGGGDAPRFENVSALELAEFMYEAYLSDDLTGGDLGRAMEAVVALRTTEYRVELDNRQLSFAEDCHNHNNNLPAPTPSAGGYN